MNVTIKSKFSMIIVLMIIVSMIFSYIITSVIVFSNIESRFNKLSEKKRELAVNFIGEEKEHMVQSVRNIAKDGELIDFFAEIENFIPGDVDKLEALQNYYDTIMKKFARRIEGGNRDNSNIEIFLLNKDGKGIFHESEADEVLHINEGAEIEESGEIYFVTDKKGKIYIKANTKVYDREDRDIIGYMVVKYEIGMEYLTKLKKIIDGEIVLCDKKRVCGLNTFGEEDVLRSEHDLNRDYEYKNNIYKIGIIEIVNVKKEVGAYIFILDNKNGVYRDIKEISIYLFVMLFFVFALIFIFSIEVIDSLVDSIKELTIKVNRLRCGDFDISLGRLKKKNDEIGILAQDFEEMVSMLKNKINELQEVSRNKDEYSEKIEITNKELEKAKEKLEEKNKSIDIINKTLKNRIAEITNLYYLIISVSKDIAGEKFYNSIIRGLREGLGIRKVGIFENEGEYFVLKGKIGFSEIEESIESSDTIIAKMLEKEILGVEESRAVDAFGKYENPHIISLVSDRDNNERELYGFIVTDSENEFKDQDIQSIVTYIRTIILAFENRNLYTKLLGEIEKLENTTNQLRESEKFKNIFLANVSHEIKSPIVPIKGYIEMMAEGKMGDINVKQRKALIISRKNIERLEEIIDNILNYSKMESGKYQIIKDKFSIMKITAEAIAQMSNKIEDKKLKITRDFRGYDYDVYGDADAIRLVILNLISNAVKFSGDEQEIRIALIEKEDRIRFLIEDKGVGIGQENLNLIFESFKQIDAGDTRKFNGLGLGLTIVKYILNLHSQELNIESGINTGTKVYFELEKERK